MTMKNIKLFVLIVLLVGCKEQSQKVDGFIINGNINQLNNSELLMLKFIDGGIEMDSISVVNHKFEYSGQVKEPYFVQLLIKDGKSTKGKLTEFMLENSEIKIEGNSTEFDSINVFGSKSDKILKSYLAKDETLVFEWDELKLEYDKYVELNDTINRKRIAQKLNKILKVDRVGLLRQYVSNNSNSTVGALLPSFCTIESALTSEHYKEFYQLLSSEVKATNYGQGLLEKSIKEEK